MPGDPILNDLSYVKQTGQELDILNFYKSFPITSKAQVTALDEEGVWLIAQPPGSVCLLGQSQTILLSRGLPEAVRARIVSFNLSNGKLLLTDFGYVDSHFGERMIARVQPADEMPVVITANGHSLQGQVVDVSLSGLGVYVLNNSLTRGSMLQVALPLPEGQITLPGKVTAVTPSGHQQRLSITFTRNAQEVAMIMRYVKDRRLEILDEVGRLYDAQFRAQD